MDMKQDIIMDKSLKYSPTIWYLGVKNGKTRIHWFTIFGCGIGTCTNEPTKIVCFFKVFDII